MKHRKFRFMDIIYTKEIIFPERFKNFKQKLRILNDLTRSLILMSLIRKVFYQTK